MNRNDSQFIVNKIRSQYTEKQSTDVDLLKKLDLKVKRPAEIFAYIFGSISAIVMGSGMSLVMTDIAEKLNLSFDPMVSGIVIGLIGMIMAIINYPIYKSILKNRKKKYGAEILEISERILNK